MSISLAAAVAGAFLAFELQILPPQSRFDWFAAPTAIVLAALLCESASWKAGAAALFLGNVSYALYLTHTFTMELWLRPRLDFKHNAFAMLATLAACVAVAALAHYALERPMMTGLRRAINGRRSAAGRDVDSQAQGRVAAS